MSYIIGVDGAKKWFLNGRLHRENGPAVEHTNGAKEWFLNGRRHRLDGPAVEYVNGDKEWWVDGRFRISVYVTIKKRYIKVNWKKEGF